MKRPAAKTTKPTATAKPVRLVTSAPPVRPGKPVKQEKPARPLKTPKTAKVAKPAKSLGASKPKRSPKKPRRITRIEVAAQKRIRAEARRFGGYNRTRRAIALTILGSILSLVLLVLATFVTPMLAVETIEIKGASRIEKKQLVQILNKQLGKPLPLVSADEIAKDLENFALIESFSAVSQPPHTLLVRITERQPIVLVYSSGAPYLYDPAGVQLGRAGAKDLYPILKIAGTPKNSAEFKAAIDVLLAIPASLLPKVAAIDAKSKDDVSMQLRGYAGQRIIWGDGSASALKSKVLAALLKNQKGSDRVTYDVSSPSAPVVRY